MSGLQVVEVETNIAIVAKQNDREEDNSVLPRAQRTHSTNWIPERVTAVLDAEFANGSMPA